MSLIGWHVTEKSVENWVSWVLEKNGVMEQMKWWRKWRGGENGDVDK